LKTHGLIPLPAFQCKLPGTDLLLGQSYSLVHLMWDRFRFCLIALVFSVPVSAQESAMDSSQGLTLEQCIHLALQAQPLLKQASIDESIARSTNRINLSAGLPQVSLNAAGTHYFQLPTAFIPNTQNPGDQKIQTTTGLYNTVLPQLTGSQALFSNDVFTAIRTSPIFNRQASENTRAVRINVVSNVSNAFYEVLLSQAQIQVFSEDTARLGKNLRDAYNQYVAGIVDKVDFKRASISLNNSIADLKNAAETIQSKMATLKQAMGFSSTKELHLLNDTARMMEDVAFDTSENLDYTRRIEFQQLHTNLQLQHETTVYYLNAFLPSISAFYAYIPEFENDKISGLFGNVYPYSSFGLNLSLPIFQGFKRIESIHRSRLQEERLHWSEVALQQQIYSEYESALTAYKSNFNSFLAMKSNVQLATEVYEVIKLQYREGIKQYLEVITAESDLRSSEINYLNALYHLLESKVSLQKALGDIPSDI